MLGLRTCDAHDCAASHPMRSTCGDPAPIPPICRYYHAASFATQFRVGALAPLGFIESSPNLQALFIPLLSICVQNMSSKRRKLEMSQKSRVSEHVAGGSFAKCEAPKTNGLCKVFRLCPLYHNRYMVQKHAHISPQMNIMKGLCEGEGEPAYCHQRLV